VDTLRTERPMDYAEHALVERILSGAYTIGDRLPPERELAADLGVTRPTLREAMRRLEQEGWLLVKHGKPTLVRDFWREGGLTVLNRIIQHQGYIKPRFVADLLEFRLLLAPTYTREALQHNPERIRAHLESAPARDDSADAYSAFDWALHRALTAASGSVIYPLMLNGFAGFYERLALIYFQPQEARDASYDFYVALGHAAHTHDAESAYTLTASVMRASIDYWRVASATLTTIPLIEDTTP